MSLVETLLAAWSVCAIGWWIFACWLVAAPNKRRDGLCRKQDATLTVFKPIPPASSPAERAVLASAVASFLPQLGPRDEMLIGVVESESAEWLPTFSAWREKFSGVRLIVCQRPEPRQRANPKNAWLEHLSAQARGELWLWSDADIVASAGGLDAMKQILTSTAVGAVTSPYCVREIRGAPEALDALFVNAEFLPGALLLARLGPVKFSFGAAVLFRAEEFRRRVSREYSRHSVPKRERCRVRAIRKCWRAQRLPQNRSRVRWRDGA